jgi:hypothetical protein
MSKKMKQKIRTYIFTCYTSTKSFHEISTCRVACVKKKKINAKIGLFAYNFFLFCIEQKKYLFFCDSWVTHIYSGDVHVEFFSKFFWPFEICLFVEWAYAPWSQIEFSIIIIIFTITQCIIKHFVCKKTAFYCTPCVG